MYYHAQKWLSDCPNDFRPTFYRRYIDDLFLLFKHPDHAKLFLNNLNYQHQNKKFTCETELYKSISFLDILITRCNNKFETSVFRKETFTGLGTSYFSYCSQLFKVNAIKTLLHIGHTKSVPTIF